jgi:two-component system NtrC family sensor kinase
MDARELQQVLVNLLVNAAQASKEGGGIEVETRDWEERGVVIRIRDHGEGIREAHLPRVFDPFFTTKKSGGTGLGLSVSYGIITSYGGDIRVSSAQGEGATFEIFLLKEPVLTEEAALNAGVPDEISTRRVASQG